MSKKEHKDYGQHPSFMRVPPNDTTTAYQEQSAAKLGGLVGGILGAITVVGVAWAGAIAEVGKAFADRGRK